MADQLRIEIDVSAARQALTGLTQEFGRFSQAANTSVTSVSASITRLNAAMANLKAINPNVLSSVTQLNQALQALQGGGSVNAAADSLARLGQVGTGLSATAQAANNLKTALEGIKDPAGVAQTAKNFQQAGQTAGQAAQQVRAFSAASVDAGRNAAAAAREGAKAQQDALRSAQQAAQAQIEAQRNVARETVNAAREQARAQAEAYRTAVEAARAAAAALRDAQKGGDSGAIQGARQLAEATRIAAEAQKQVAREAENNKRVVIAAQQEMTRSVQTQARASIQAQQEVARASVDAAKMASQAQKQAAAEATAAARQMAAAQRDAARAASMEAANAAKVLAAAQRQAAAEAANLARAQAQVSATVGNLGRELLNAAGYMTGLGVTAGNIVQSLGQLSQQGVRVSQVFAEMSQQFGRLGAGAIALAGVAVAAQSLYSIVSRLVTPVMEVSSAFQTFELAIDAIDGEGAGTDTLEKLQGIAQRTAQDVTTLTKAYTGLRAGTQAFGLSSEQSLRMFENFSGALRALGADTQKTEKAFLAITQVFSKGSLQMEELRGQLGDALPGAFQYTAQAIGKTTGELEKMIKAGQAGPDVLVKLGEFLNVKFGDAIAQQVQTATGQLALFQSNIQLILDSLGRGGLGGIMAGLASGFRQLNEALNSDAVRAFAAALGTLIGLLTGAVLGALGGFIQGVTGVAEAAVDLVKWLSEITGLTQILTDTFGKSYTIMNLVADGFQLIGRAIGALLVVYGLQRAGILATSAALSAQVGIQRLYALAAGQSAAATVASTAATVAAGTASAATAGAVGILSRAFQFLTSILSRNPFVLIVAALGAFYPLISQGVSELYKWATGADKAAEATDKFASTQATIAQSLENVAESMAKSPTAIIENVNAYNSLENAQKRAAVEADKIDEQIKQLEGTMKNNAASFKDSEAAQQSWIRSQEASARSLQETKNNVKFANDEFQSLDKSLKLNASSANSASAGLSGAGRSALEAANASRGLDREIKNINGAIADSNASMADRKAREDEWNSSMQRTIDKLKEQKANLTEWKFALDDSSVATAKSFMEMGKSKDAAAQLAFQIQELTKSESERVSALKAQADSGKENLKFLVEQIKLLEQAQEAERATLQQQQFSADQIEAQLGPRARLIQSLKDELSTQVEATASADAMYRAKTQQIPLDQALAQTSEELAKKFGLNVEQSKALATAIGSLAPKTKQTGDAAKDAADKSKQLGDETRKNAEEMEKAATAAERAEKRISTVATTISTAAGTVGEANATFAELAMSFTKIGDEMASLSVSVPQVGGALVGLNTSFTAMQSVLPPVVLSLTELAAQSAALAMNMPTVASAFLNIATSAVASAQAIASFAAAFQNLSSAAAGIQETTTAVQNLVNYLNESVSAISAASAEVARLGATFGAVRSGMENAVKGGDMFIRKLQDVKSNVEGVIASLNAMKAAAEAALRAAIQAQNAGSSERSTGREGGRADELIGRQRVNDSAFNNAPQFAEGTTNTSRHLSKVSGGGIPSILHPNEAVIPLSKGRSVPVELSMGKLPEVKPPSLGGVESGLDSVAVALRSVASALAGQKLQPVLGIESLPQMDYEIPDMTQSPTARVSERVPALRTSVDGLESAGAPQSRNRNSERSASTTGTTNNITINVTTDDADSFKRSEDQIARRLSDRIRRANRRAGN